MPQTSGFCSTKEILVVSFATQPRAFMLTDRNIFYTPPEGGGGRTTARSNAPGAFLVLFFFGGHLPQTSAFRSAKQILVVSFATQATAFILSDRNIFYTPVGRKNNGGSNAPGAFYPAVRTGLVIPVFFCFFFFCRGHLPQPCARSKQYLPVMCARLAFIRQNFHESWCRKLLAI